MFQRFWYWLMAHECQGIGIVAARTQIRAETILDLLQVARTETQRIPGGEMRAGAEWLLAQLLERYQEELERCVR